MQFAKNGRTAYCIRLHTAVCKLACFSGISDPQSSAQLRRHQPPRDLYNCKWIFSTPVQNLKSCYVWCMLGLLWKSKAMMENTWGNGKRLMGQCLTVEFHGLICLSEAKEQVLYTCQGTGHDLRSTRGPAEKRTTKHIIIKLRATK